MLSIAPNLSNLNYHSRNNSYFLTHKEFLGLSLNNALSLSHSQASVLSLFFYYSESSSPNYLLEEKNNILNDQEEKKFGWTDKTVSQIQAQLFKTKSRATVGKHIKSLEDHGWLESCPSALHKQGKQYRVNLKLILRNLESSPELVTSFCEKKKISDYKYQNSQNKTEFTNFSKIHNKYLSAHQGLVALSGSLEGGFVLSYFLQLANNLEDRNEYLNEEHGNFKSLIESKILYGWISKSQAQIKKAIGLKVHHSRVTALFKTLIEKNWLDKIDRRKERKNNLYRINIVKIIHDLKKAKLSYLNLEDNFELVKDLFERIGIQEESAKEKDGLPSAWKPSRQRTRTVSPAHKNSLASAQEQSRQRTSNIEYIYNKNNRGDNTPDPTSSKQIKLHSSEVIPPPISSKIFNFNFEDANNHALTTYSWNVEFIKEEFEKFQGYYNALEETQKANSEFFWKQWCKKVKKSDITRWEENQKVQNNNQLKADETESYEEITRGGWGELTNYTDKIERKMTSVIFQALSRNINITKEDQGYHLNFSITTNEIGSDFAKNISSDDWLWFAQDIAKKYQKPVKLFLYNFGKKFKTICSEFEQATKVWGIQEKNIYKTCANEQEKFCDFNDNIDVVETYITLPGEKKQLVKEPNYRTLQDALQPFIYDHIPEGTQVSIEVKLKDLSNDNFVNSTWKEFLKHVAQQHKTNCSYKILFYNNGQENREVSLTEEEARSHREFYYGTKANKINRINS